MQQAAPERPQLANTYPEQVHNMRFEVDIEGDKLHFNYLLQEGISQNLNATFLMEGMGIMPQNVGKRKKRRKMIE